MNLGLREQSQFDTEGSSIYVRLFPFYLATSYCSHLIIWVFPSGLGHFESTDFVKFTGHSYGGTGSPKALVDLGYLLFVTLAFLIGMKISQTFNSRGKNRFLILRLNI